MPETYEAYEGDKEEGERIKNLLIPLGLTTRVGSHIQYTFLGYGVSIFLPNLKNNFLYKQ